MQIKKWILPLMVVLGFSTSAFIVPEQENKAIEGEETFYSFLSQFAKSELPFSIDLNDMDQYDVYKKQKSFLTGKLPSFKSTKTIKKSRFIPELERGKFSRIGPPIVEPVARFYPNDKMIAVVYSTEYRHSEGLYKDYNMLLFDLQGTQVGETRKLKSKHRNNSKRIAFSSSEKTQTAHFDKQGRLTKVTYENDWLQKVHSVAFTENRLLGFKKEKETVFQLGANGNLVALNTSIAATPAVIK